MGCLPVFCPHELCVHSLGFWLVSTPFPVMLCLPPGARVVVRGSGIFFEACVDQRRKLSDIRSKDTFTIT